jgi:hypothetical protein
MKRIKILLVFFIAALSLAACEKKRCSEGKRPH